MKRKSRTDTKQLLTGLIVAVVGFLICIAGGWFVATHELVQNNNMTLAWAILAFGYTVFVLGFSAALTAIGCL